MELPWLLRTWRKDVASLSQAVVTGHLGVSRGALSMWESGERRPGVTQLEALDDCYGASGALVDLAAALGTPRGLPPRHQWAHNPQGPSGPHWAWLRSSPGARRIHAHLRWGAFKLDCSEACDDRGLFVTSPVSMTNPAVWVLLGEPGWVDFGRGEIPARLSVPALSALTAAEIAGGGHSAAGLVAPRIVERFVTDEAFAGKVLHFFGDRPDLVRQVFSTREGWHGIARVSRREPSRIDAHPPFTAEQYRTLRTARGLSQADAAELATRLLPQHPVRDDQVRALELGRNPRAAWLRSRLDAVYRADGWTCVEAVQAAERRGVGAAEARLRFDFPDFWIGPVWVAVRPSTRQPEGHVRLEWDGNIKPVLVTCTATLTCRKAFHEAGPLLVTMPVSWQVSAGMGNRPEARDVNFGWWREGGPEADAIPDESVTVNEVFLHWFDRSTAELAEFLRREASDLI